MPRVRQILILAIEGWNARFFEPETMPFLSEISKHFVVFPRHYSSGNNTLLGINGIVFGQTPALFFEQRAINAASEPIRRFRDNGFSIRRFAVHSNYRNFGSYMTGVEEDIDSRSTSTSETFPLIRRHLKAHDRTLSLYYYGDSHYPYRHATEYSRFQPEAEESMTIPSAATPVETAKIVNRYRNALSEADARLEELFASIDWKSMVVVVTGDHGESMMENGRLSHSSSLEEPQIRTPMLLYFPGVRPAVFQGTSSHLDIMPTLLHVAGLGTVTGLHGSSLLLGGSGRHALVAHNNQDSRPLRLAVVSDKSKLVLDISDIREPRLVDLLTLDDRVARLQDVGRVDVEKSLEFVLDVLASSGCLQNYSASTNGSGSPPLRHCRAGR